MKVALLHDWLLGMRGGEKVLLALSEIFPQAQIYTLLHRPGSTHPVFDEKLYKTSFLNKLPERLKEKYRYFLPLFPLAANNLKIDKDVDLILSSSHCVIKGVPKRSDKTLHISYIHSPMRYIYDQFDVYFEKTLQRTFAQILRPYLTYWDKKTNSNVDYFLANSSFIQQRIKDYYAKESKVIHPFVDDFYLDQPIDLKLNKENFFLMVGAFAPNKKVDLAIEAFNFLGLPLKIIGSGQMEAQLKQKANNNIEFLGFVDDQKLIQYLQKAKALIFPGVEDFGITPLEALASGTPVIAYKKGGVLDTLDETTGVFFDQQGPEALINAIKNFELLRFDSQYLKSRAQHFSKSKFQQEIKQFIHRLGNQYVSI